METVGNNFDNLQNRTNNNRNITIGIIFLILGQILFLVYPHLVFCGMEFTACSSTTFSSWFSILVLFVTISFLIWLVYKKVRPEVNNSTVNIALIFYTPILIIFAIVFSIVYYFLRYIDFTLLADTPISYIIFTIIFIILGFILILASLSNIRSSKELRRSILGIMMISFSLIYLISHLSLSYNTYNFYKNLPLGKGENCKTSFLMTSERCIPDY